MKKILLFLFLSVNVHAEVNQSIATDESNRQSNKMGVTTGFGNPFPSILGMSLNYNLTDLLRVSGGYGEVSVSAGDSNAKVTTLGGGVDVLVPGWSFSPMAGVHVSKVDVSGSNGAELSIQGIKKSTTLTYAQLGLDWQSQGGFNFGAGAVAGLSGGSASGSYVNLGWFF